MQRIYLAEGKEHIAYEKGRCSKCHSEELVRMSDNPHYGWLCLNCSIQWYGCSRSHAVGMFTAALVAWCMQLLPNRGKTLQ